MWEQVRGLGPTTDWSPAAGCRKSRDVWPSTLGNSWLSQGQTSSSTVRLASWFGTYDPRRKRRSSWFGTDDPLRERGAERADSVTARSEYLGFRRRCKRRVHPGAGYPAGLTRDSGRWMPWATTGQDVVSVREEPTASVLTRSSPTESHRNRRQLCWQCGGTCRLRIEPWREKSRVWKQQQHNKRLHRTKARQKRLIISTGSSGILWWRWWRFAPADGRRTWGLLGTSSLKVGAMLHIWGFLGCGVSAVITM
jgi:hypothetical protein